MVRDVIPKIRLRLRLKYMPPLVLPRLWLESVIFTCGRPDISTTLNSGEAVMGFSCIVIVLRVLSV